MVVGRRPALEAVRAGLAREILVSRAARETPGLRELLGEAEASGVGVVTVEPREVDAVSGGAAHQGVAARVRLPPTLDEGALARSAWDEGAIVVALDGITDPHNVGAIARSAEAAGASALVLRSVRGARVGPAAVKTSAGALLHLRVAEVANLSRALERLKDAGFWIVGLDADAEATITAARRPPGHLAIVVGSEGGGLSRLVRETCDERVSIPMRGRVGSLNASAAAAVALFSYTGSNPPSEEGRRRVPQGESGGKAGIQ